MNAAIEAAHAGNSGKGFAIVAQSIRKLADNTTVSTKGINEYITKMNSSLLSSLDKFSKQQEVFSSLNNNADELNSVINSINNSLENLDSKVKSNYKDVEELVSATSSLKNNISNQKENNIVIEKLMKNINGISDTVKNLNSGIIEQIGSINGVFETINDEYATTRTSIEKLQKIVIAYKT
jgi:methyl-accepting chemotaxis protein